MELIIAKLLDNIIYTPFLLLLSKPIKTRVNNFLEKIWPWYVDSYYKLAATNLNNRAAMLSLFLMTMFVFIGSEIMLLDVFNPSIPIVDNVLDKNPVTSDKVFLFITFLFNLILFVGVLRLELIYSTINRFNQMTTILRPDLEQIQYYRLKKSWALMKSETDYKSIIKEIFNYKNPDINKENFPEESRIFNRISEDMDGQFSNKTITH